MVWLHALLLYSLKMAHYIYAYFQCSKLYYDSMISVIFSIKSSLSLPEHDWNWLSFYGNLLFPNSLNNQGISEDYIYHPWLFYFYNKLYIYMCECKIYLHIILNYIYCFPTVNITIFSSNPNNNMQGGKCGLIYSMNFSNIFIHLLDSSIYPFRKHNLIHNKWCFQWNTPQNYFLWYPQEQIYDKFQKINL